MSKEWRITQCQKENVKRKAIFHKKKRKTQDEMARGRGE
jgi:hypothetical protein